ncbi:MAG: hypothetical protein LBU79_09275, partial [Planctomycetota bacterium]|nr:hypothetical protein [Planctomycetota bacterium]
MPDEEAPGKGEAEKKSEGGLLGGIRGWIIVIAITLLQAAFWITMMIIRQGGETQETAEQVKTFLDDTAILQSRVDLRGFAATVPGPGGDLRPLSFDAVL